MDDNRPEASAASGVVSAPILTERDRLMNEGYAPFEASGRDMIAASAG